MVLGVGCCCTLLDVYKRQANSFIINISYEELLKLGSDNVSYTPLRIVVVYSIVSISVIALSFRFVVPFFRENLPGFWGSLLGAAFTILCISPFLRAIMVKKNHSTEFTTLWEAHRANRAPLVSTIVLRMVIAVLFVMFIIAQLFKASIGLIIGVAILLVVLMVLSRQLKKRSILIERKFFQNLRSREMCIRDRYGCFPVY